MFRQNDGTRKELVRAAQTATANGQVKEIEADRRRGGRYRKRRRGYRGTGETKNLDGWAG